MTPEQEKALALARARRARAEAEAAGGVPEGMTPEQYAQSLGFAATPGGVTANPAAVDDLQNRLTTLGANTANAMAFGLGDESVGLRQGVGSLLSGGEFMPAYREGRDATRANMGVVSEEYPSMATTGTLVGAAIPAITAAPAAMGNSMLQTVMRGAGIGAAEGGLQGAGYADGRGIWDETVKGALIGGGVGVAAPALVGAAGAIKNAVKDPVTGIVDALIGRANTGKANRAISGALGGKSQQEIDVALAAARAAGQPEFRMMDALGLPGQRLASGMTRAGGDPAAEIAEYLSTRQAGQGERVGSFVEDAFDVGGTTAAKTREGLVAARGDAADTAYAAARGNAAPVNLNDTVATIDELTMRDPLLGESALKSTEIGARLAKLRAQMATGDQQLIDFNSVLNIKQDLYGIMEGLRKSGKAVPVELSKVYGSLDSALEASSDMYRTANDGFREASRVIGAVDDGAMMATRGRAADNVPRFQSMTAPQQGAARVGYGDKMLDQLERVTSPTSNRAKPLQSPKRTMEASAMAQDYPLYADRLGRENTMWETQNRALGGSRTADNLADQQAIEGLAGGAMGAMRSAANFQIGDAVAKIAALLGPIAKGQNSATRNLIAQALLSGDASVLAPAIAQATKSAKVRRAIEAVIRQPLREGVEASVE